MPNIEIKSHYPDLPKAREIAKQLQTATVGNLHQIDTYFETKQGRLKLREINGKEAQLIPYSKDYQSGPMKSSYAVLPVEDIDNTKSLFEKLLGTEIVVDKNREVFLIDNVRVHLDQVKDLGTFLEFEAVYVENSPEDKKREEEKVSELMDKFFITKESLLDKSYVDYFFLRDELLKMSEFLYSFENPDLIIAEFKRLDKEETAPPQERFFWFLFDKATKKLQRLEFISMERNTREFAQGSLDFSTDEITFNEKQLNRAEAKTLSPFFIENVLNYFK